MLEQKYTLRLNVYFDKNANPEMVINFIYRHVYELINEIKYIPHVNEFE